MLEEQHGKWTQAFTEVKQRRLYQGKVAREAVKRMNNPTGLIVEGNLLRRLEEQGFSFNLARDNKSIYNPDEMFPALERYFTPSQFKPNRALLSQAVSYARKVFGKTGGEGIDTLDLSPSLLHALKQTKSSGLPSLMKKGDAFQVDLGRAQRIADGKRKPDPCMAYHRIQHGEAGPKTRLVWGYPQSMTILESLFARPLIDHFLCYASTPMAFGWQRHEVGAKLIHINNSNVKFALDYSKFDSFLSAKLIDASFEILRTWFDLSDQEEKVWNSVVNYFIHTPILMPDGYTYMKHRGIPSGSYFTQLIGSIANFICTQYIMLASTSRTIDVEKMLLLGDDVTFAFPETVPLHVIALRAKEVGMKINQDKSAIVLNNEAIFFLGHTWNGGVVDRPVSEIAKRIVFPETHVQMDIDERIKIRQWAYLSDATSSWNMLKNLSVYSGPYIEAYLNILTKVKFTPITGYQVYQAALSLDAGQSPMSMFMVGRADILK